MIRRHEDAAGRTRFSASAVLPLPDRDVCATAVDADLYAAIVKLVERLVRRSGVARAGADIRHASRRRDRVDVSRSALPLRARPLAYGRD